MKTQSRDKRGRYNRVGGFIKWSVVVCVLIGAIVAGVSFSQRTMVYKAVERVVTVDRSSEMYKAKIETLKNDLVNDLAVKCETKGAKDPDGVIIFDSNNEASIGAYQFQRKTVIYY